jgi:hypothetical protein
MDLKTLNREAMALQKGCDEKFWKRERTALRIRRRKVFDAGKKMKALSRKEKGVMKQMEGVDKDSAKEIDEELGRQLEVTERALLASGDLEWEEAGKMLGKMKGRWGVYAISCMLSLKTWDACWRTSNCSRSQTWLDGGRREELYDCFHFKSLPAHLYIQRCTFDRSCVVLKSGSVRKSISMPKS